MSEDGTPALHGEIINYGHKKFYELWTFKEAGPNPNVHLSGLYYKLLTIVIYDSNAIGQYYKTTIVVKASLS